MSKTHSQFQKIYTTLVDPFSKGAFFLNVGQFFFVASSFLVNIILVRFYFTTSEMGLYGTIISILVWLEIIVSSGLAMVVKRNISRSPSIANEFFSYAFKKQLYLSLSVFVFTLIVIPVVGYFFSDRRLAFLLAYASIDLFFYSFFRLTEGFLNGLHLFKKQAVAVIAYSVGKLIGIVALVAGGYAIVGALTGNFFSSILGFILAFYFFRRSVITLRDTLQSESVDFNLSGLFASSIWIVTLVLNMSVSVWIIMAMRGSEAAGFYVIADIIAKVVYFSSDGIRGVTISQYSKHYSEKNIHKIRSAFLKTLMFCVIFTGIPTLIIVLFADPIIQLLFTHKYLYSAAVLKVLPLGYFFLVIYEVFSYIMIAFDRERQATKLILIFTIITIPILIYSADTYGSLGLAYAFTITQGIGCLFLFGWLTALQPKFETKKIGGYS